MPQELISQFDRKIAMPIETFRQVQTINLRDAIPTNIRWEGMIVYVMSEKLSYVLVGGLSNSQWVDLGTLVNVTVRDNLTSTSTTDALSANQGRILKGLIDNIDVDIEWGDITGTLSDQTDLQNALNAKQSLSQKGLANGYAPLDSGAKIPLANLPDSILGQVSYQGTWNPSTNVPTLTSPTTSATKGHYYVCTTSGTRFGLSFNTGDWVISNGVIWDKVDNSDAVTTVFGRIGNIVANAGDYTFAQIGSKPTTIAGYGITDFNSLGDARWLKRTTDSFTGILTNNSTNPSTILGDNASIIIRNSSGTTFNTKSELGFINGSSLVPTSLISSEYKTFTSGGNYGAELIFSTKVSTDASAIERFRLNGIGANVTGNLTITGNNIYSGGGNRGILQSNNTNRMLIGGGSGFSNVNGAYISIEGIDYGGTGLGGGINFVVPSALIKSNAGILYDNFRGWQLGGNAVQPTIKTFSNGTNNYFDLFTGNLYIRDDTNPKFTFERTTGNFTATGNITGASHRTTNWEIVEVGGVLQFKHSGNIRFQMKSTGIIEATNFKLGLV